MIGLLIDAGNTRLKWALVDLARMNFLQSGHLPTAEAASVERLAGEWQTGLARQPALAMFVSVADEAVNTALFSTLELLCPKRWVRFVAAAQVAGVANAYANPTQLGADRLAAAIGAWQRTHRAALVVNCGTATTIDLVAPLGEAGALANLQKKSFNAAWANRMAQFTELRRPENAAEACFAGGVILPGVALMKSALFRNTARLPDAAGQWVAIPDNTDDAIATGCLEAQSGAVRGMRERLPAGAPVVLSGGAASLLRPLLAGSDIDLIEAPELVLEGLAVAILRRFPQ